MRARAASIALLCAACGKNGADATTSAPASVSASASANALPEGVAAVQPADCDRWSSHWSELMTRDASSSFAGCAAGARVGNKIKSSADVLAKGCASTQGKFLRTEDACYAAATSLQEWDRCGFTQASVFLDFSSMARSVRTVLAGLCAADGGA